MKSNRPFGRLPTVTAVAVGLMLTGCAAEQPSAPPPEEAPSVAYWCEQHAVADEVIAGGGTPAAELGEPGREALTGLEVPELSADELESWIVLEETAERVVLLREREEPDALGGWVRTHDIMAIEYITAPDLAPSPGWMLTRSGSCSLARDLGELGAVGLTLDPDAPPDPASTEVSLLATEQACNSGQGAEGRLRVVELVESTTAVRLLVAVEPRGGEQSCPSNPATPFTIELDSPLGERTISDMRVTPEQELTEPSPW